MKMELGMLRGELAHLQAMISECNPEDIDWIDSLIKQTEKIIAKAEKCKGK